MIGESRIEDREPDHIDTLELIKFAMEPDDYARYFEMEGHSEDTKIDLGGVLIFPAYGTNCIHCLVDTASQKYLVACPHGHLGCLMDRIRQLGTAALMDN